MSDIQNVKDASSIVDVIGRYVELQQSGSSYKGICPFHQERTPSFHVWPDRQYWKCFGACSEGGDVITFLMKIENMDFPVALRSLAAESGVEIASRAKPKKQDEFEPLYQLLGQAAAYFRQNLAKGKEKEASKARAYLAERKISAEISEDFQIGLSPRNRTGLLNFMRSQNFEVEDLLTVNLVIELEDGAIRDRFMGLLMFPIRNARGRVIGFGARQLPPESDRFGKYINTARTPLFNKSEILYGIEKAMESIRREQQAVIVEGYFDAITAHQYGHTNTVACMGTAVTPEHIQQLQRITSKITFALDADTAGQSATIRNLDRSRQALQAVNQESRRRSGARDEVQLTIVKVPPGQDPDELIRTDAEAWPRLVKDDISLVDFYAEYLPTAYDFSQPEEKQKAVYRMATVLAGFQQPVTRDGYINSAAGKLQVSKGILDRMVQEAERSQRSSRRRAIDRSQPSVSNAQTQIPRREDWLLGALCWNPIIVLPQLKHDLESIRLEPLSKEDFSNSENIVVYEALQNLSQDSEEWHPEALRRHLDTGLQDHFGLLEGIARTFRNNDSQEVSQVALEHLLSVRTRSVNRNLELLNIGEDTSSEEGAIRTQVERKQLYAERRSLDEARDRVQHQLVSE